MEEIVIVGSSGLAKEIAFLVEEVNKIDMKWNIIGFIDTNIGEKVGKYSIVMNDEDLLDYKKKINVIIGVGFPNLIKKLSNKFKKNNNLLFPNIIHPNCIGDWDYIQFGEGNIVTAGNIFTTDIKIKSFNIFNLNGTIGHDTSIGSYNIFNPTNSISGNVCIEDETLIGTGAQVLQNISIEKEVIIGAGAVVTKNVTEKGIYVGSPAKKLVR